MGLRHFTVKKTRNIIWIVHHIISDMKDASSENYGNWNWTKFSLFFTFDLHLRHTTPGVHFQYDDGCRVQIYTSTKRFRWGFEMEISFNFLFSVFHPETSSAARHLTLFIIARSLVAIKNGWESFPTSVCVYLKCLLHACALALNWICNVTDDDDMSIQNQLNSTHRTQSPFVRMCGKNANTFSAESLGGVLKLQELYFDILIFLILYIIIRCQRIWAMI